MTRADDKARSAIVHLLREHDLTRVFDKHGRTLYYDCSCGTRTGFPAEHHADAIVELGIELRPRSEP